MKCYSAGKQYAHETEELVRKQIFAENLKKIEMHNFLYSKGLKSFTLGVNKFADMVSSILNKASVCLMP